MEHVGAPFEFFPSLLGLQVFKFALVGEEVLSEGFHKVGLLVLVQVYFQDQDKQKVCIVSSLKVLSS